jgi:hypothetical protein
MLYAACGGRLHALPASDEAHLLRRCIFTGTLWFRGRWTGSFLRGLGQPSTATLVAAGTGKAGAIWLTNVNKGEEAYVISIVGEHEVEFIANRVDNSDRIKSSD